MSNNCENGEKGIFILTVFYNTILGYKMGNRVEIQEVKKHYDSI